MYAYPLVLNLIFFSKQTSFLSGIFSEFAMRQYQPFKWTNFELTKTSEKLLVTPVASASGQKY